MNMKTLTTNDIGRRVKYTLPYKSNRRKNEQTVYVGILIDFDKTHATIFVEAFSKAQIKALPFDVEFTTEKLSCLQKP